MSATGQGGVSIISSTTHTVSTPIFIAGGGGAFVFTHNVGRRAFQVLITDSFGNVFNAQTNFVVTQPTALAITVTNFNALGRLVFISPRWEENTVELFLVPREDPRITFVPLRNP